jgi:aspartyl/asparaginyl beta-hydroxylase (cupin superfamily)
MAADESQVRSAIQQVERAFAMGQRSEGERLLSHVAATAPEHPLVLNAQGQKELLSDNGPQARKYIERAIEKDGTNPAFWVNLASALRMLALPDEEMRALDKALGIQPRHLFALLQKATLLTQEGRSRTAAGVYEAALASIPPGAQLPPSLRPAIERAEVAVRENKEALGRFVRERTAKVDSESGRQERFDHCLDITLGVRRAYAPEPTFMYFPHLPAYEFYPRELFPWLPELEAAIPDMRAEFERVFVEDQHRMEPYVAYPDGVPIDQWKELNHSRRWSAFYLWREGAALDNLSRCPKTAAALAKTPRVDIPAHGPTAFFSILDAHTHIPPHTGTTNTRLTVHVPLVLPGHCSFRVGADRFEWRAGEAWVFDDTINHEAWNDSDAPRAILIFDVWNPYLTSAERDLVRTATVAVEEYYGGTAPWVARN